MAGYIGTAAVPQATQKRQAFTATAGQTSFATSGYSVGFVDVYMNGVKLAAADYTATNGSDVVLATAALVNDIVEIVAFTSFVASDGLAAANNLSDLQNASTARTNLGVTLPNLGVTSTAAELNNLDAVPRGSIIYGNSSAATARLSKGATGTVLTAGADDISWVEASGGGEQTFTATGAITAGNPVGLTPTGTISVLPQTVGPYVASSILNTSQGGLYGNADYDTSANQLVQNVRLSNNNGVSVNIVYSISGYNVTYPSGNNGLLGPNYQAYSEVIYDSSTNKSMILAAGFAFVGTVSGTGTSAILNLGSIVSISQLQAKFCFGGAGKIVTVYRNSSNGYLESRVGTISGTSFSWGGIVTLVSSNILDGYYGLQFDPDTGKVLVLYRDTTSSPANKIVGRVGTISGTSISWGTAATSTAFLSGGISLTYDTNVNKMVAVYPNSATYPEVLVATISGTDVSFGSPVIIANSAHAGFYSTKQTVFDPVNNVVHASLGTSKYYKLKVSGTTVGVSGFPAILYTGNLIYDPDNQKIIMLTGTSGVLASLVINPSSLTYVGFAAESISDGATGKATVVGGINTNQSGLIAGTTYGIAADGTALVSDAGTGNLGVALTASNFYVTRGTP